MQQTQLSGSQQSATAETDSGSSNSSQKSNSKFSSYVESINGKKLSANKIRQDIFLSLYDNATDNPSVGKWYLFEYDPKFKDQLKEYDQYPLIHLMEFNKGNLLGANIHYLPVRVRLSAINNNRFPESTLHYYIPKNADGLFFEVDDLDVPVLSQFPVQKFHRNK